MDSRGIPDAIIVAALFTCFTIIATGVSVSYITGKRLTEIRTVLESTNATLGEICARADSLPENAKIWYFIPRKEH